MFRVKFMRRRVSKLFHYAIFIIFIIKLTNLPTFIREDEKLNTENKWKRSCYSFGGTYHL